VTEQQQRQLLESFRGDSEPGTHASYRRAAEVAGVDPRTARRAFKVGWPGVKPIRDLIEVERTLSRAALRREVLTARMDEASRLAMEDAVQARADEGRSVRAVTSAATGALLALHAEQVHVYERTLARLMQTDDPNDSKAKAARRAFLDIAMIISKLAEASATGQRCLALVLGSPTHIISGDLALRPVVAPNADAAALMAEIEAARRAADELKELEAESGKGGTDASNDQRLQ
jgi:hypothetical protein